jgi:transposase-like protein
MADRETTRLKTEIAEARKRGERARYSDELKARVVSCVARRRARGHSCATIARELELGLSTLHAWQRGAVRKGPALRRVVVAEAEKPEAQRFTVEGRGGLRVVGLSLNELRELLGGDL